MNDKARKRLSDLEDFLYGATGQSQEEVIADLRDAGVDTDRAAIRIEQLVQQKRDAYLQRHVQHDDNSIESELPHFDDFSTMPRELLLASFEKLSDSTDTDQDTSTMSDEDLRSWLSAITELAKRKNEES